MSNDEKLKFLKVQFHEPTVLTVADLEIGGSIFKINSGIVAVKELVVPRTSAHQQVVMSPEGELQVANWADQMDTDVMSDADRISRRNFDASAYRKPTVGQLVDLANTLTSAQQEQLVAAMGFRPVRWGDAIHFPSLPSASTAPSYTSVASASGFTATGGGTIRTTLIPTQTGISSSGLAVAVANARKGVPFWQDGSESYWTNGELLGAPTAITNRVMLNKALAAKYAGGIPGKYWDRKYWTWNPATQRIVRRMPRQNADPRVQAAKQTLSAAVQAMQAFHRANGTTGEAPPEEGSPVFAQYAELVNNLTTAQASLAAAKQLAAVQPMQQG